MIPEKLWNYVYIDSIQVTKVPDENTGKPINNIDTLNRHLFTNGRLIFRSDDGTCLIFSDKEIKDMELVSNNLPIAESRLESDELEALI